MNQETLKTQPTRLYNLILTLYATLLCATPAWAGDPWDDAADGVLDILNGGIMRTIAVIVVILVGVGILAGRVGMEIGVRVIGGIVVIFAAGALVDLVVGWSR